MCGVSDGKKIKSILCFIIFMTLVNCIAAQKRKVVFVIVDGIAADVIVRLSTPNIDSISEFGGFAPAYVGGEKGGYSQTPTISAVGYNTVLTGTWVNKHNVWDNDIADPNYNYKNIFRLLKEDDSTKTTAVFSSWLENRTRLVNMNVDYHVDGMELDTVTYPHDEQSEYMKRIDEVVTDSATFYIRTYAPDLSWIYLQYTDDMGHMYGDDPRYFSSVQNMDALIGKIYNAVKYRQEKHDEDWLLIITTDHGRDSVTGKHHGGQSTRERSGWIATNAKKLNSHFRENASIADIMPTIARFMKIRIPRENAMEVDGVPFTGIIPASDMTAKKEGNKIRVAWKPRNNGGKLKIWLATTNNYKIGGKDDYRLAGTYETGKGRADIDVSRMRSDFYKVVIETSSGFLNRWVGVKVNSETQP